MQNLDSSENYVRFSNDYLSPDLSDSKKKILNVQFSNAVQKPNIGQLDIISQLRYYTGPVFG